MFFKLLDLAIVDITGRIPDLNVSGQFVITPFALKNLSRGDCKLSFTMELISQEAPCINITVVKVKRSIFAHTLFVSSPNYDQNNYLNLAPLG
jgi:hypothetical protein